MQRGAARCVYMVSRHKRPWGGSVHLAYACNPLNGEFWAIVSDESTSLQTFCEYGLRFDIDESFLDDQSGAGIFGRPRVVPSVCSCVSPACGFDALSHRLRRCGR